MSYDQYPYPAQNKRWLSDKLDEMIELAMVNHAHGSLKLTVQTGESFVDIPIDTRHIKKKPFPRIPKDWLKLSPERRRVEQAVDEQIYQPALSRCVQLAKVSSIEELPKAITKRLRGIVNATVRNAVRPAFYADMNDPQVREMVISESLKHLVWSLERDENRYAEFVTPDLSDEEFEMAFKAEQERIDLKAKEDLLRMEEDRRERLYNARQEAVAASIEEVKEINEAEIQKAKEQGPELDEKDKEAFKEYGLDEAVLKALKLREERRKLVLSRLDEDAVPEWLKHAVDTDDKDFFPLASGRFSRKKTREDEIAEFFQIELDDAKVGSEKEAKLLEFIQEFLRREEIGLVEEEGVEQIKKRVNAMLKEIEDREEGKAS